MSQIRVKSDVVEAEVGVGGHSGVVQDGLYSISQLGGTGTGQVLQLHPQNLFSED